ncbi:hypothetical protein KUH03_22680 [Sphingobacterium sp. E70]|uniref:sodium:solute symporter family transporter n=1 Tax=Sphingobacterium sp. E70 TaxID=2853439 RepID=UPI00211BA8B3|nr:hypothetical protein [Sphingobacterium sp. E70]ULT22264.1 hypothetical protein KUH03_22680 [Sphingobacterium sp. E70]
MLRLYRDREIHGSFFPWEQVSRFIPLTIDPAMAPQLYGIFFTAITTFYVMLGGMHSIVWADMVKFAIMIISGIAIAVIAMQQVSPELLAANTPEGWDSPFSAGNWIWIGVLYFPPSWIGSPMINIIFSRYLS